MKQFVASISISKLHFHLINHKFINSIITSICLINSSVKYTLRRLKYLNSIFPNLGKTHFNFLIDKFHGDINVLDKLFKYYLNYNYFVLY